MARRVMAVYAITLTICAIVLAVFMLMDTLSDDTAVNESLMDLEGLPRMPPMPDKIMSENEVSSKGSMFIERVHQQEHAQDLTTPTWGSDEESIMETMPPIEVMPPVVATNSTLLEDGESFEGHVTVHEDANEVVYGIHSDTSAPETETSNTTMTPAQDIIYGDMPSGHETMPAAPTVPPTAGPAGVPTTAAPTSVPTTAAPTTVAPTTATPTATPTPEPATCDTCLAQFVENKGCGLWKDGADPKLAIPDNCRSGTSPMLAAACKAKLAQVCSMKKHVGTATPPPPEIPCSEAQRDVLATPEHGHLGCSGIGGQCVDNVGVPKCSCKPGYSGKACDVGPAGDRNATVSAALSQGMDLITEVHTKGSCKWPVADGFIGPISEGVQDLKMALGRMDFEGQNSHFLILEASDKVDWIREFQFVEADIAGHKHNLHLGFWRKMGPLLSTIGEKVIANMVGSEELVVLGYGQAGALANIFAFYAQTALNKKVTLITYGAPRVGDYAFATALTTSLEKVHRVVRDGDPFVVVPTTSCKDWFRCMGGEMEFVYYVHAGTQITIPATAPSACLHPTFIDEGVDGGLGHITKLQQSPNAAKCFSIHKPDGYASGIAHYVAKDQPYVCSKPSFEYVSAPSPPIVIEQKLYIQKPPSLNTWGPKDGSIPVLASHGVHLDIPAQAEPKA